MPALESDSADLQAQSFAGGRYRVLGRLGRGGMAAVYRVLDTSSGRTLALKRLQLLDDETQQARVTALFEREFHTLAQLAHPGVVEVYDFGIDAGKPYYTMELLDSGDLQERSPLPWRKACELIFDVCSALALVHSRRLVHRDISPRNIRCTQTAGAKIIDFGALAPIGPNSQIVGTPAFIAPEALNGSTLDARTDLYSVGATLYFVLTGRRPYPARDMAGVMRAWAKRPTLPSSITPDVPTELDALVMAMIRLDPTLRPPSAYEVMQCLASIAGLERSEPLSVSRAYLATPSMVGRDRPLLIFRRQLTLALAGRGSSVLIAAGAGLGRSRFLDVCVLDGKTSGAIAIRAGAHDGGTVRFASARALARHLLVSLPSLALSAARSEGVYDILFEDAAAGVLETKGRAELRNWSVEPAQEPALQDALERWLLAICDQQPLLIAVDDVEQMDSASLALLAALAHRAHKQHLLVCATAASASLADVPGLAVLASHSVKLALPALELLETEALLTSLFGDASNIQVLSQRVHVLAGGRPRDCMALAQHLIDRGVITYAAGIWTLPEQIASTDLPASFEAMLRQRVSELSPEARALASAQALAIFSELTRDDYALLAPALSMQVVDVRIDELVAREIVVDNGLRYTLSQPAIRDALLARLTEAERRVHHGALAELQARSGKSQLAAVSHLLSAGLARRALELLTVVLRASADSGALSTAAEMRYADIGVVLERALDAALELGYPPRELNELRRWLLLMGVVADAKYYERVGPALLAQLERDSGLSYFRAAVAIQDPTARLTQALTQASEAYAAQPEGERVFRVDEAITNLVHYVVASIAVGANILDTRLIATLPALLEPFAALSPVLHAIWQNALATHETLCLGRPERARQRWVELYQRLEHVSEQDLRHVTMVRNAVAFGLGSLEAQLGLESAGHWADILDRDPTQRVSAMYLRKTACVLRGDFAGAESFRRKAELLGLQATSSQMFTNLLGIELSVHASARDLTGVKRIRDRIEPLAAKHPGWRVYRDLAEALFKRLHGDLEGACAVLEQALLLCEPDASDPARVVAVWPRVATNYIEVLIDRDRFREARAFGQRVLVKCDELGIVVARFDVDRALALAEAMLGDQSAAEARLERIIAAQCEFGVTGLNLGLSYEARTRVAILSDDRAVVEHYAQLTAREYGHGRSSALGARYERLMLEARSHGITTLRPAGNALDPGVAPIELNSDQATVDSSLGQHLSAITDHTERAQYALRLLCNAHAAQHGHLYLVRDASLVCAASSGANAPSPALDAQVRGFWNTQLDDVDMPTAFVPTNAWLPSSNGPTLWTDFDGTSFRTLILQCTIAGSFQQVGVLVVASKVSAQPDATAARFTTTIAAHLVQTSAAT